VGAKITNVFGYHGRYLRIDVTRGKSDYVSLDQDSLRRFLGGSGLGTYLLLREKQYQHSPLSADAALVFAFSPLVGSPLTTSAKFAVVCKSPLTGLLNDSLASSAFAIAGKRSGADAIVIYGKAEQPSVLVVDDSRVYLEPAGDLWGSPCDETQDRLRERFSPDFQFAVIGPAGERQVRFATISHDGRHAGRGGSGAVLGAKNLKAIAVRGSQRCTWAHARELTQFAKQLSAKSLGPATAKYRELGTASNVLLMNRLKSLPTRNFQQGSFAGAAKLAPETLAVGRRHTRAYCAACTIGCEHIYSLRGAAGEQEGGVRLEYENLFALGPLCGIDDSEVVLRASQRCDQLGMDTISAGGTIAFAMECVERGLLDADWLRFGDGAALMRAIDLIADRRQLGDQLAEGSRRLAEQIGHGAIDFAPQVKGLEIPGYEPRSLQTMALGFAVGARGADHNRSGAYEVDFSEQVDRHQITSAGAKAAAETEDRAALFDSLILCKFLRGVFEDIFEDAAEMLRRITGWEVSRQELLDTARRIVSAKKLFNIRAGWQPEQDTLPQRFLTETLGDDPSARLSQPELAAAVRSYNVCRGWTPDGWIDDPTLRDLGLGEFVQE